MDVDANDDTIFQLQEALVRSLSVEAQRRPWVILGCKTVFTLSVYPTTAWIEFAAKARSDLFELVYLHDTRRRHHRK